MCQEAEVLSGEYMGESYIITSSQCEVLHKNKFFDHQRLDENLAISSQVNGNATKIYKLRPHFSRGHHCP